MSQNQTEGSRSVDKNDLIINNLIIIKGGAYRDVKKALRQWIKAYRDDLLEMRFELYKNGRGNHILKADERLDNDKFYFLVNYLDYPENIIYTVDVRGFTLGTDENILKGKNLMVYLPKFSVEGDNVYVCTSENENFKVDFGGKISRIDDDKVYEYPKPISLTDPEVIKVNKRRKRTTKSDEDPIQKRFKIISIILIGALFLGGVHYHRVDYYLLHNAAIGAATWLWFFIDYKMLQQGRHYVHSMFIALFLFVYGSYIKNNHFDQFEIELVETGMIMPLFFLSLQWPFRFIFKLIVKREPVIEKPVPSFADGVYTISLMFLSIAIPFFYFIE